MSSVNIEWDEMDEMASRQGKAIKDISIIKPKRLGRSTKTNKQIVFGGGFDNQPRYKKRGLKFDDLPNIVVFNIFDDD